MKFIVSNRSVGACLLTFTLTALLWSGPAAAVDSECVMETPGLASMSPDTIRLVTDDGSELSIEVLVADDNYERASGFQHICAALTDEVFILFVYTAAFPGRFHMQNVHAPLDIAFFDDTGKVVDVQLMQTYTETSRPLYGPGVPFQFALEARKGFFADSGISSAGSRLVMRKASD